MYKEWRLKGSKVGWNVRNIKGGKTAGDELVSIVSAGEWMSGQVILPQRT